MSRKRKVLLTLSVGILLVLGVFTVPRIVDEHMNGVAASPPYAASKQAGALHERLFVAVTPSGVTPSRTSTHLCLN